MKLQLFAFVTIAETAILLYEWPKLRKKPTREKTVFAILLLSAWCLSMFDLPNVPGPTTLLKFLFSPLKGIVES